MELMKKMTPEHVSEFLDTQKKEMENHYKENRENKIFLFAILLITLVFIVLLIQMLKDKPDIMEKVLFTLGGLITGLFGGYGIGKAKDAAKVWILETITPAKTDVYIVMQIKV